MIDIKNAFNSIDRSCVLNEVYSKPKLRPTWPIVDFAYSEPSHLLTRDANGLLTKSIESTQGVRQGDPLASLLFAIAMQPIYDEIVLLTGLEAVASHDALSLVGKPDGLINDVPILQDLVGKLSPCSRKNRNSFIFTASYYRLTLIISPILAYQSNNLLQ